MNFEKKTKSILYGMDFTHGIRRALIWALSLIYFVSLGFPIIWITTLFAVSTIIMVLFEFPTGAIADYDSRKKSLMISFFLMFIAFLGIFLFKEFWLIVPFWILGDIAWTFSTGAGSAWVIDTLDIAKEKNKIASLFSKGAIFEKSGHIIGGLIGFFIITISFRFIWLAIALTNLTMFFIIWKYMEERNFKPTKTPHNYATKSIIKAKESFSYLIHSENLELRILMIGGFLSAMAFSFFYV